MLCVQCGYENPVGSNYCEQCYALMPRMDLFQVLEPTIVSDRLRKIQNAVNKVEKNEMSIEDFAEFIVSTYETLIQKAVEIQELVETSNYFDISPEEVEVGYKGMGFYEQGLLEIYHYVEDYDPVHLSQGLEMVTQGNNSINEAMRINRENREKDGVFGTL